MLPVSMNTNTVFTQMKQVPTQTVEESQETKKKPNVKKAIAIASAAAASVGLALIAINKIKKGQKPKELELLLDPLKKYANKGHLEKYVNNATIKNQAQAALEPMKKQISGVARRTKPSYVAKRVDDLAKAFGAAVEHVAQNKSIIG